MVKSQKFVQCSSSINGFHIGGACGVQLKTGVGRSLEVKAQNPPISGSVASTTSAGASNKCFRADFPTSHVFNDIVELVRPRHGLIPQTSLPTSTLTSTDLQARLHAVAFCYNSKLSLSLLLSLSLSRVVVIT